MISTLIAWISILAKVFFLYFFYTVPKFEGVISRFMPQPLKKQTKKNKQKKNNYNKIKGRDISIGGGVKSDCTTSDSGFAEKTVQGGGWEGRGGRGGGTLCWGHLVEELSDVWGFQKEGKSQSKP